MNKSKRENETQIAGTNDIATISKLSAALVGYYNDDFVKYFAKTQEKKQPLINRGHFARVSIIRDTIKYFVQKMGGKQIISLGAGFDTNFFQLSKEGYFEDLSLYVELDVKSVVKRKVALIHKHANEFIPFLRDHVVDEDFNYIASTQYHLISTNLRDVKQTKQVIEDSGIDYSKPTLFISECVLIYISAEESNELLQYITDNFEFPNFVIYEQIRPHDPFGKVMARNLEAQGSPLLSLTTFPDLESQKGRFLNMGWIHAEVLTMNDVYNKILKRSEVKRIEKLEIFDELEEWQLVHDHYCVVYASNSKSGVTDGLTFLSFNNVMEN